MAYNYRNMPGDVVLAEYCAGGSLPGGSCTGALRCDSQPQRQPAAAIRRHLQSHY